MRHVVVIAMAALMGAAACTADTPPPPPESQPSYPDAWLGVDHPDLGYAALALHETANGLAGHILKDDGTAAALRNVQRTDKALAFRIPAFGAAFNGEASDSGAWSGQWTDPAHPAGVSVRLTPANASSDATSAELVPLPDGRRMHIHCEGNGVPVVLLDYGAGGTMKKDWGGIATAIAEKAGTRVCLYDRAGRGLSDPGPMPRDAASVVADMDGMLAAAKLPPPYILIGHSLGSYHVRLYANTHPEKVGGLVLVDPSGDGQLERFNAVIPKVQQMQEAMFKAQADLNCIGRLRETPVPPDDPLAQQCGGNDPDAIEATKSEIEEMPGASTRQLVESRRSYGRLPMIVLTRMDYETDMPPDFTAEDRANMQKVWVSLHTEMAALSKMSLHRFVLGAGHYIQRDRPEAVIDAAVDVVTALRTASR